VPPTGDPDDRTTPREPAVRTALARLAAGGSSAPAHPPQKDPPREDPAAVVSAAEAAATDLDAAAAFRTDGGLERLRSAVEVAAGGDDRRTARRGQRVLAAFERARTALDAGSGRTELRDDGQPAATGAPDHFRRGRGTPLSPAVEAGDG